MALDQTFCHSVSDHLGEQAHRANSVVVTRNQVLEVIGVCVGIKNSDNGNTQLLCFVNGEVLAQRVNNPHGTRGFGQRTNSTQRLLELGELTLLHQKFFLGVTLGGVFVVDFFEFLHAAQTLGHGLEVGEQSAQPTLVDIGLAHTSGLFGNRLLSLLFGADEQHGAAVGDGVLHELISLVNKGQRLLQVNDVNTAALGQDEALDFRVPAAGLVSEVNTTV